MFCSIEADFFDFLRGASGSGSPASQIASQQVTRSADVLTSAHTFAFLLFHFRSHRGQSKATRQFIFNTMILEDFMWIGNLFFGAARIVLPALVTSGTSRTAERGNVAAAQSYLVNENN